MCPQRRAKWPNGAGGYSTRRHMLEPVRPAAVLANRQGVVLTDRQSLLDSQKNFSLCLSLHGLTPKRQHTSWYARRERYTQPLQGTRNRSICRTCVMLQVLKFSRAQARRPNLTMHDVRCLKKIFYQVYASCFIFYWFCK